MHKQVKKNRVTFQVNGSWDVWKTVEDNSWESSTFAVLDHYIKPTHTVVDIGAWIGPISLYSASLARHCFSFEPDPVAYKEFSENIKLNPSLAAKITAFNKAITTDGNPVKLFSRFSHGDSGSSLLKRVKSKNDFVETESLTFKGFTEIHAVPKIDFIKMDVEGSEFFLLPTMLEYLKKHKPTLLISFHHAVLCEFFQLKYLPFGFLRRVYRFLFPSQQHFKKMADKEITKIIGLLGFYDVFDSQLHKVSIESLIQAGLENIDSLVFHKS